MLMVILGVALVAILLCYFIVKWFSYWADRGVKQIDVRSVLRDLVIAFKHTRCMADLVVKVYNEFPNARYSGIYQLYIPVLVMRDPDLIKQITVKDSDHFTDHMTFVPENVDPLWEKNLFSLRGYFVDIFLQLVIPRILVVFKWGKISLPMGIHNFHIDSITPSIDVLFNKHNNTSLGQKWRDMRAILSPSFTSSKMRSMFVLMKECAESFVQHFLKKDEEIVTVEFKDIFTRFTNDVIATTAFGVKVDSLAEPNNEFYLMGKEATNVSGPWTNLKFALYVLCPKLAQVAKLSFFSKKVRTFFEGIVNETIKIREEKGIARPDMINLLMEARKGTQKHEENGTIDTGFATALEANSDNGKIPTKLTNMDITAQALVFFFAGFDSVSGLMCFTAYELAANPDIQGRLRKEVEATLHEYEGKVTYEGLLKMKYMDMVVSETLRKWPNAVAMDRVCTKPYTIEAATPEEKTVHLEKGTVLWLPIFALHRDPKNYPNPDRFDPERFGDANKGNIKPYTYCPFGLGPRGCIGSRFALLETKIVFFYILQHFELVPVEKSQIPLKLSMDMFNLGAEGGFWFGMKRIKN